MTENNGPSCEREHDFALIVGNVFELTEEVMSKLFEAGCDDATPSMHHGWLYLEFSRTSKSLKDAIVSAILDVERAGLRAVVMRVDECNLVTAAEIARRIDRSRQLVHQYITGTRGPGGFPPPACHITDRAPLWEWCAVSYWLVQNSLLKPEEKWNAEVVYAINTVLEMRQQSEDVSELVTEIGAELRRSVR